MTSYTTATRKRIWLITEADRSSTTFLLPHECWPAYRKEKIPWRNPETLVSAFPNGGEELSVDYILVYFHFLEISKKRQLQSPGTT
jgi:hypothetical protein